MIMCYFFMLTFIILGKESCTFNNVDVYLQPPNEKLQVLQEGVDSFDAYVGAKFTLKTMCMWNIHDFPTYGLFANCVIKYMLDAHHVV